MEHYPPIWSDLSVVEHEFQYNPQKACPQFESYRQGREPANEAAAGSLDRVTVAYGDHPLRALDIYPAPKSFSPVHVYYHGGYWRAQDKANFAFVAGALAPLGVTSVIVNYELCPDATLDDVVDSALEAMRWVYANVSQHGGDPARITLSGHSAGAHLVAEIIAHDWEAEGFSSGTIRGATLISGIYDPTPAIWTSVNADLRLTEEIARRHNVEARRPRLTCPIALFAGGAEPWQWIDQTFRYSHCLRRYGLDPAVHVLPGINHFNILNTYLDTDGLVLRAIRSQIEATS